MTHSGSAILSAFAYVGFGALLVAQAPPPHPAAKNPHLGNQESIRGGMALYRVRCADCHGLDATGYRGPDLIAVLAGGIAAAGSAGSSWSRPTCRRCTRTARR